MRAARERLAPGIGKFKFCLHNSLATSLAADAAMAAARCFGRATFVLSNVRELHASGFCSGPQQANSTPVLSQHGCVPKEPRQVRRNTALNFNGYELSRKTVSILDG